VKANTPQLAWPKIARIFKNADWNELLYLTTAKLAPAISGGIDEEDSLIQNSLLLPASAVHLTKTMPCNQKLSALS
jgi:hypothetical protein